MMLHENKDAFKALISSLSERTNIREDIIEKDYYLTLPKKESRKSAARSRTISIMTSCRICISNRLSCATSCAPKRKA